MLDERLQGVKRPETPKKVQDFFTSVAKRYDLANSLMSFGMHYSWKRKAVKEAGVKEGMKVLDICSGTNDVAIIEAKIVGDGGHITALDWNEAMQAAGQFKIDKFGLSDRITNVIGDAEKLPFEDNTFDRATVAVASRHLNIDKHFQEMYRVLKPGGRGVCVDFFQPPNPLFGRLYNFYSYAIMPKIGTWITGDKTGVYDYLPDSIRVYYTPEDFSKEMIGAGFKDVKYYPLTQGIVYVHAGNK
ncbi:MAG TPA: ubiquinone/menaquinone biosynthesis methyltransferase [Actinobacteria bacterium]|nr:ubiquinone/menaquinone biosynthesis methyltransferase [Actinomycetes bacterium]HEX21298.1 ubiquinone/menaquinone biosynthesis methyltransferase [Actinomycetota bacterium]